MLVSQKFVNYLRAQVDGNLAPDLSEALDVYASKIVAEYVPFDDEGNIQLGPRPGKDYCTVGVLFTDGSVVLFKNFFGDRAGEITIMDVERDVIQSVVDENFKGHPQTEEDFIRVITEVIAAIESGRYDVVQSDTLFERKGGLQ